MSRGKPKYWITTKYGNRIGHRKLSVFEERNMGMFNLSRYAHETWAEAYAYVLEQRKVDVTRLKHKLKLAEAQLAKAKIMKPPGETP